jgi:mono/diheme cytochrome c family protein
MKKYIIFITLVFFVACNTYKQPQYALEKDTTWKVKTLPTSPQQLDGDPEAGLDYLLYGDYLGSGVPYDLYLKKAGNQKDTVFYREGDNAAVNYNFTAFTAFNGQKVVNGNCFTCHAGELDGKMIVGLGNSFSDYRQNITTAAKLVNFGMKVKYKKDSKEMEAFRDFGQYFRAMAPNIQTNQPGVNPAARLAEACMMHRDPKDLTYRAEPQYEVDAYNIGSDVPPLWNVKKKNALYYNGVGRGDFTKLLFQASVLGIPDSTAARKAVTQFKDVYAWLCSLEPPAYPKEIDEDLAARGKVLFEDRCSKCHGTYGDDETYPNKVVALGVIDTDPYYAIYGQKSGIIEWYNNSWFANSSPRSYFEPELGYVAPPLDGIWATAPYLHNGSVPTLDDLLNSKDRPAYWTRSKQYDYDKVGWTYQREEKAAEDWTYDTTLPAYSNSGHDFGDHFETAERKAVIEYLKTL